MDLNVDIQKPSIAVSFGGGRTANQLCNFASGYALWREFGILNYLDENQLNLLGTTFELPQLNEESDTSSYYLWRKECTFISSATEYSIFGYKFNYTIAEPISYNWERVNNDE